MTKRDDDIAELQRQIDALKAAQAPPVDARAAAAAAAAWDDEMHQRRERRANDFKIAPEVLRGMVAVCPDEMMQNIVHDNQGPKSPTGMSPRQVGGRAGDGPVRVPGGGTGWVDPVPLSPPPGVNICDRLMSRADEVERQNRVMQEAQRQALLKPAEEKLRKAAGEKLRRK